jgi:hypothetical protein
VNRAKIILLSVAAAVAYGILHDQITARLCIEYFTIAHPPLFPATSPTIIALCWGTAATLGIGLILGVLLALAAHSGTQPPLPASRLLAPIARLLITMAFAAFVAGASGFALAQHGVISMPAGLAEVIPSSRHDQFLAVWFAHGASYLVGLTGGAFLVFRLWRARGRHPIISLVPRSMGGIIRAVVVTAAAAYILWLRFRAH